MGEGVIQRCERVLREAPQNSIGGQHAPRDHRDDARRRHGGCAKRRGSFSTRGAARRDDAVAKKAARLKEIQSTPDSPEALATIPSLGLKDLSSEPQHLPRDESTVAGYDNTVLLTRELPTAGIIYADVALDLRGALDPEDLPLVPLFGRMMQETGIK